MRIERAAFATLAVITLLSSYTLAVAIQRFGDATETFDGIEFELGQFRYDRSSDDVEFTMTVVNGGVNELRILGLEYSYVVSGVLAGGGDDLQTDVAIGAGESQSLDLAGRITDSRYVDQLPLDESIRWLVRGRILVNVDERLGNTWIGFAFRTETP
jgi:hypothetical protein